MLLTVPLPVSVGVHCQCQWESTRARVGVGETESETQRESLSFSLCALGNLDLSWPKLFDIFSDYFNFIFSAEDGFILISIITQQ